MSENSAPETKRHTPSWLSVLVKNFAQPQFILGGIVPAAIMIILSQYEMVLEGALISSCWAFTVLVIEYFLKKRFNFIAIVAAVFAGVQFVVALVSKNVEIYLLTTVIEDLLYAAISFASLLFARPLIQVIVESVAKDKFSEKFRQTDEYRKAWVMLTIFMGLKNIADALIKAGVLHFAPMEAYLAFRPVYNNLTAAFMIFLYFWYPAYFWKKKKVV